jgi:hypothetical protein
MRRLMVTLLVAGLLPLAAAAAPAEAADLIEIRGQVGEPFGSARLENIRFCAVTGPAACAWSGVDPTTREFAAQLAPGDYRVELWLRNGFDSMSLKRRMTLTTSDTWSLELPPLVPVDLTALNADGSPFAGARVPLRHGQEADDIKLSPDLPAFAAKGSYSELTTDEQGRARLLSLPDSRLPLNVRGYIDGVSVRLPLSTPSKTWVNASAAVKVTARALPMRTVTVNLRDAEGDRVPVDLGMSGRWGKKFSRVYPATGPAVFTYPQGRGVLELKGSWDGRFALDDWRADQPLRIDGDESFALNLPATSRVRATVKDADTGEAVAGATVSAGGPADAATLGNGLDPARLFNGAVAPNSASTEADGRVAFSVFPDSSLDVDAVVRTTGTYRTADRTVDASDDTTVTLTLPKSVEVTLGLADEAGDLIPWAEARLELGLHGFVMFANRDDGLLGIRVNPGPATIKANLGQSRISVTREVDVLDDTALSITQPTLNELTVYTLAPSGRLVTEDFRVQGTTSVMTESGPHAATFFAREWSAAANAGVTFLVPPMLDALVDSEDLYASISNLDTTHDRAVALVGEESYDGAGAPVVLPDAVDAFILDSKDTVSWRGLDADRATFTRTVLTPFGGVRTATGDTSEVESGQETVTYDRGATTCLGAVAYRGDLRGPNGMNACRTRPLDDRAFFASDGWERIDDVDAYGGSYRLAVERGARLSLGGLDVELTPWEGGAISVLASTGPNAGTVRLRMGGEWISDPVSLVSDEPAPKALVPVTFPTYVVPLHGKLHVVVTSDGKPVRVDGIAIVVPASPMRPSR